MNRVVSNTGPIISLEHLADGFDLLRLLFAQVLIPEQVLQELAYGLGTPQAYLEKYQLTNLVQVVRVHSPDSERAGLDPGETYAITLALQENLPILLEDRMARRLADKKGLKVTGIAGCIKMAHDRVLITTEKARALLDELYRTHRLPKRIFQAVVQSLED